MTCWSSRLYYLNYSFCSRLELLCFSLLHDNFILSSFSLLLYAFIFHVCFRYFFSLLCINETLCTYAHIHVFYWFFVVLLLFVVWTLNTLCSVKTSGKTFAILFCCFIVATMAYSSPRIKSFVGAWGLLCSLHEFFSIFHLLCGQTDTLN